MRQHSDLFRLHFRSVAILQSTVVGETSLRKALVQFEEHDHTERSHQGLENQIIQPMVDIAETIPENRLPQTTRWTLAVRPPPRRLADC